MPNKILKEFYDKIAQNWTDRKTDSFYHEKQFNLFIKYLRAGESVIDIGCASGIHVPLFLGIGHKLKYDGLDISEKMIAIAQSRYPQLKFTVGDILEKNFLRHKRYGAFWSGATLMHIPLEKWPKLFLNLHSILKNKAIGYITLPLARPNPESESDKRHFTILTYLEMKKALKTNGFDILNSGHFKNKAYRSEIWCWFIVRRRL